jgi:DNA mismatch endonuclease (patch repair protein)
LGKPVPATNKEFWAEKRRGNAERDRRNRAALLKAGWRVFEIWECETRDAAKLEKRIAKVIAALRESPVGQGFRSALPLARPKPNTSK